MSVTPITDLIDELSGAGLSISAIRLAVRAVELSACHADSHADSHADKADRRRQLDRLRKQKHRAKSTQTPKANDVGAEVECHADKADSHADKAENACDLSYLLSLESQSGNQEVSKKESKKEAASVIGRAEKVSRGTRLSSNSNLSDDDRKFAFENGIRDPDQAWAEFIDYWIAIPGARGTKLNWSATWRNRIRQISTKGKPNGTGRQTLTDIASDLADEARELERQAGVSRSSPNLRGH